MAFGNREIFNLDFIRQNLDLVRTSLVNRQIDPAILDTVLSIDDSRQEDLALAAEEIPNIPAPDVPIGKDWTESPIIKTVWEPTKFDFIPLDHVDLGEHLDIIDIGRTEKISGSHFSLFKNEAATLEMSLMFYAFTKLTRKGFKGMLPPVMIKEETEWGCGYDSKKDIRGGNRYSLTDEGLVLVTSSEHSVIPIHSNETISAEDLPLKYVNYSQCFRREPNIFGKDLRGLLRVHNFNKVEINAFSAPNFDVSDRMCLELLGLEEEIMQELGLPYQIVKSCTGDLPRPNRRMYDINTWFPGQGFYRETHSCSNCGDFQSRRFNTTTIIDGKTEFVHTLNATVMTDRVLLAILENNQQADHSIKIPEVLWPLTGFEVIKK